MGIYQILISRLLLELDLHPHISLKPQMDLGKMVATLIVLAPDIPQNHAIMFACCFSKTF